MFIQFKIWERGDIGIAELRSSLIATVRKALCDLFIEYYLLSVPISLIPTHLHHTYTHTSRCSSAGSQKAVTVQKKISSDSFSLPPKCPQVSGKRFLSEPCTPVGLRARSPGIILHDKEAFDYDKDDKGTETKDNKKDVGGKSKEPLERRVSEPIFSSRSVTTGHLESDTVFIDKRDEDLKDVLVFDEPELAPRVASESNASVKDLEKADEKETIKDTDISVSSVNTTASVTTLSSLPKPSLPAEMEYSLPRHPPVEEILHTSGSYDTVTDKEVEESFNATFEEIMKSLSKNGKDATWQEIEVRRRQEKECRKLRRKFERGVVGQLNPW